MLQVFVRSALEMIITTPYNTTSEERKISLNYRYLTVLFTLIPPDNITLVLTTLQIHTAN